MNNFTSSTNYGMTVSASDKLNYYKAIIMKNIIAGKGLTSENETPKNLKEAVNRIIDATPDIVQEKIIEGSDELRFAHFGLGKWIRNNWGLWGGSKLQEWFHEKGIRHADDMSGIILETVKREIRGEDWDIAGQVQSYREYWKKKDVDPDKIGLDEDE